jgi:hypothetical protein
MRGLRIKNLVRQDYDFVSQFCQVTELLSVEKEHNSIRVSMQSHTINRHHRDQVQHEKLGPSAHVCDVAEVSKLVFHELILGTTKLPETWQKKGQSRMARS